MGSSGSNDLDSDEEQEQAVQGAAENYVDLELLDINKFRDQLRKWANECLVPHSHIDKLLKILNCKNTVGYSERFPD